MLQYSNGKMHVGCIKARCAQPHSRGALPGLRSRYPTMRAFLTSTIGSTSNAPSLGPALGRIQGTMPPCCIAAATAMSGTTASALRIHAWLQGACTSSLCER